MIPVRTFAVAAYLGAILFGRITNVEGAILFPSADYEISAATFFNEWNVNSEFTSLVGKDGAISSVQSKYRSDEDSTRDYGLREGIARSSIRVTGKGAAGFRASGESNIQSVADELSGDLAKTTSFFSISIANDTPYYYHVTGEFSGKISGPFASGGVGLGMNSYALDGGENLFHHSMNTLGRFDFSGSLLPSNTSLSIGAFINVDASPAEFDANWFVDVSFSSTPFGDTPENAIGAINEDRPFQFRHPVLAGIEKYFDPAAATGFDFESLDPAMNFSSVHIPYQYGDGEFDLFLFDSELETYIDSGVNLRTGDQLLFESMGFSVGLNKFSIRGIEPSANIDPNDPLGFVTGLSFARDGIADFEMKAVVVPLPAALWLFLSALGGLLMKRLQRHLSPTQIMHDFFERTRCACTRVMVSIDRTCFAFDRTAP